MADHELSAGRALDKSLKRLTEITLSDWPIIRRSSSGWPFPSPAQLLTSTDHVAQRSAAFRTPFDSVRSTIVHYSGPIDCVSKNIPRRSLGVFYGIGLTL
jgi:hypothetical protein